MKIFTRPKFLLKNILFHCHRKYNVNYKISAFFLINIAFLSIIFLRLYLIEYKKVNFA